MTYSVAQLAAYCNTEVTADLALVLTTAEMHIGARVVDLTAEPVQRAILMYAARLFKRSNSIEGTISIEGFVNKVPSYDADIEALITPYRRFKFGA